MGSDDEASDDSPRRRTNSERQAIVTEAFEDGAVVSEVAERNKVSTASIYLWRRQLRNGATDKARKSPGRAHPPSPVTLVPVRIAPAAEAPASIRPTRADRIEIALANGRILKACESIDPMQLARLIAALESDAP
ncbi:MAG: transposase [Gammaproteobacteria bacterium]|nr:transposase [Gammaproteobacteria bacterium]